MCAIAMLKLCARLLIFEAISAFGARHGEGFHALAGGGAEVRIYAPHAQQVSVAASWNSWMPTDHLQSQGDGWWMLRLSAHPTRDYLLRRGAAYKIHIVSEDGEAYWRPDPWSRKQDGETLGNSIVYPDDSFEWSDANWSMPDWQNLVIYELHVGTFCGHEGWSGIATLDMCIPKLDHLTELGVNAVELMPVAEFDGEVGWGYTTAYPFAVEHAYGGPDAFKRFVDACHKAGIAVIMDVVYNHLGPMDLPLWRFDGWFENDLGGIYFYNDERAETPWAHTRPNYGLQHVRSYIRDNALFWLDTMHCDGLRVDGVSFIRLWGGSETNRSSATFNPEGELMLKELTEAAHGLQGKMMIAEDLQGNATLTQQVSMGGLGFDSQWDGGFHWPVFHVLAKAKDKDRRMERLKAAILGGSLQGSLLRRVIYIESHDEAGRQRLPAVVSPGRDDSWVAARLAALGSALVMVSPGIPMLFQGQDFLVENPFSAGTPLDWAMKTTHTGTFSLHKDLIGLRRNLLNTSKGLQGEGVNVTIDEDNKVLMIHRWHVGGPGDDVVAVFNFQRRFLSHQEVDFPFQAEWSLAFNSADARYHNSATVFHQETESSESLRASSGTNMFLHPYSCVIYTRRPPLLI